jgi:hypothetical protein
VERLSRDPATVTTLRKLRLLVRSLRPTVNFAAPAQTVCNYLTLAARNFSSHLSEGDASGTWVRFTPVGERESEQGTSAEPVEGLHVNPYAHAGQNGECEAGNEPFLPGTRIGNPPGNQGSGTEKTRPPAGVAGR